MKNLIIGLAVFGLVLSVTGCADGPIRRWLRGSACSSCNPAFGQPQNANFLGGCNDGTCGTDPFGGNASGSGTNNLPVPGSEIAPSQGSGTTSNPIGSGFIGKLFRSNRSTADSSPAVSIPSPNFNAPASGSTAREFYGKTTTAGQIELPPNPAQFN